MRSRSPATDVALRTSSGGANRSCTRPAVSGSSLKRSVMESARLRRPTEGRTEPVTTPRGTRAVKASEASATERSTNSISMARRRHSRPRTTVCATA